MVIHYRVNVSWDFMSTVTVRGSIQTFWSTNETIQPNLFDPSKGRGAKELFRWYSRSIPKPARATRTRTQGQCQRPADGPRFFRINLFPCPSLPNKTKMLLAVLAPWARRVIRFGPSMAGYNLLLNHLMVHGAPPEKLGLPQKKRTRPTPRVPISARTRRGVGQGKRGGWGKCRKNNCHSKEERSKQEWLPADETLVSPKVTLLAKKSVRGTTTWNTGKTTNQINTVLVFGPWLINRGKRGEGEGGVLVNEPLKLDSDPGDAPLRRPVEPGREPLHSPPFSLLPGTGVILFPEPGEYGINPSFSLYPTGGRPGGHERQL